MQCHCPACELLAIIAGQPWSAQQRCQLLLPYVCRNNLPPPALLPQMAAVFPPQNEAFFRQAVCAYVASLLSMPDFMTQVGDLP